MGAKIFYRKRRQVKAGEKKPRFRVVAVANCQLKVYCDHLRRSELEHLAESTGAGLVELREGIKKVKKHHKDEPSGES